MRFEVSGEVLASFREAMAKLRRDAGGPLDDDAALLLMARHVLAGPADDGRASYQVAISVCEVCGDATQTGCGAVVDVAPEIASMASCDAQGLNLARVGETLPETHVGEAVRQTHVSNGTDVSREPHVSSESPPHRSRAPARPKRASQTIPPAVRRAVLLRDQHRCQVPGCRHATFVDVHHLRAREDGGGHDPDNLLTLCGAHHRACHRGDLLIEGRVSSGLGFRHADGTSYGAPPSASEADVAARAFRGLRNLGFGEREARDAVRDACVHVGSDSGVESLIRSALARLTRDSWEKAS